MLNRLIILGVAFSLLVSSKAFAISALSTKADQSFSPEADTLDLSISTPEGKTHLRLKRLAPEQPRLLVNGKLSLQDIGEQPVLFQGTQRVRAGSSSKPTNVTVAADLYQGVLRINFAGRRGRLFQASFKQGEHTGRLLHFPRSVPIRLDDEHEMNVGRVITSASASRVSGRVINVNRVAEIGIDVDFELYQRLGSDIGLVNARMLAIMNAVNAIYRPQVGLRLVVDSINVWSTSSDPYSGEDALGRLEQFRTYTRNRAHIGGDLKHLFTGENLSVDDDSAVVGLAYRGTVCRSGNTAYALSERVSDILQAIVTSHEIGHNFNCGHDDETPSLMSSVVSSSLVSFSDASLEEIEDFISANNSCLTLGTSVGDEGEPKIVLGITIQSRKRLRFTVTAEDDSAELCKVSLYGARSTSALKNSYRGAILLTDIAGGPEDVPVSISTGDLTQRAIGTTYYRVVATCGDYRSQSRVIRVQSSKMSGKKITSAKFFALLKNLF